MTSSYLTVATTRRRALLGLFVVAGTVLVGAAVVVVVVVVTGVSELVLGDGTADGGQPAPLVFGLVAVPLIALPATLLAARLGAGLRPSQVWSLRGPFRWRFYWQAAVPALVICLISTAGSN